MTAKKKTENKEPENNEAKLIDMMSQIVESVQKLENRITDIEQVGMSNAEKNFKSSNVEYKPEFNETEQRFVDSTYGKPVTEGSALELVHKVLGTDFGLYALHHDHLPVTLYTIHPPVRLAENQSHMKFHSISAADTKAMPLLKQHCEKVKTQILRNYEKNNVESPSFNTIV